jgi:DNA-binding MarR family transcriptional regulator
VNAFKTQTIRDKHHLTMQEEYVLGMINDLKPISTSHILLLSEEQNVMSPATTHKYLKKLQRKKFVHTVKSDDSRLREFAPTGKGIVLLEELKHAYVRG